MKEFVEDGPDRERRRSVFPTDSIEIIGALVRVEAADEQGQGFEAQPAYGRGDASGAMIP